MSLRRTGSTRIGSALFVVVTASSAFAQERVWLEKGGSADDGLGSAVTFVPDVDGDGVVDVLVGAAGPHYDFPGKVELYSGASGAKLLEIDGSETGDQFGRLVADLGDVDGDGVRDFAIAAPGVGTSTPVIDVYSGTGALIRAITTSFAHGSVGAQMTWVGDVDGDGVRELLYSDYDNSTNRFTVFLVSGKTGATIRTHTDSAHGYGSGLGRAGDVDGDGVDDYLVYDDAGRGTSRGHVWVFSGATGNLLFKYTGQLSSMTTAGDVDLDGHADLLLFQPLNATGQVVSGATAKRLFFLFAPAGGSWFSGSAAGDFDGDGHSDVVLTSANQVVVCSGTTGHHLAAYTLDADAFSFVSSVDATADVNGDGVFDVVAGDPAATSNVFGQPGRVFVVSGADGAALQTIDGAAFKSELGSSVAVVPDRDGDGWREVALLAPGGLDCTDLNLVQIVSGRDGHEVGRFRTVDSVRMDDRLLVSVGDVDGDAIADVAVACPGMASPAPPSNTIELHSGADDSLIATLTTPSGIPDDLASAADVNGTPLLAVTTYQPDAVYVYDLATRQVVTTYSGHGSRQVACMGDLNGDGVVDWVVHDPNGDGAANVFTGGSSPTTLWSYAGTSTDPVTGATSVGDLDGDGFDDVLAAKEDDNVGTGKVVGLSGVNGTKRFEIAGPGPGALANFGSQLATLGDVDRDGVCDFVVGAKNWDTPSGEGAFFVYSGRTNALLYRLDSNGDVHFDVAGLANQRWHDDPRVDPDASPDLVVGSPAFPSQTGRAALFRLDDLMLQVDPPSPVAGTVVTATTSDGPAGNLVGLYALDLSGTPLGYFLALGVFDVNGQFVVSDTTPASMAGLTLDVIGYGVGFHGKLADSERTAIAVQ